MEVIPSNSPSLSHCPDDIQNKIFSYVIGKVQAAGRWIETKENFKKTVNMCRTLQLVSKKYCTIEKIAQFMNINEENKNTLLMRAAETGAVCLIKYAIRLNAALDCTEDRHDHDIRVTPLSMAVRGDNYKSCLCLLEAGADVNKWEEEFNNDGCFYRIIYQPIHLALHNNDMKITELLINYKADVNSKSAIGTPLTIAYNRNPNDKYMIHLLIKHGAK
jgi:hypothetical protein